MFTRRRLSADEYTSRSYSSRALLILLVIGSYLLMTLDAYDDALPDMRHGYSVADEINRAMDRKQRRLRDDQVPSQLKRALETFLLQQRSLRGSDVRFQIANAPFKRVLAKCINSCVQGHMSFIRCRSMCK